MSAEVDPITFEVIRNALTEITETMSLALRRSAYSTNIKTRADFSCALFDRKLNEETRRRVVLLRPRGGIPYGVAIAAGALIAMVLQR